MYNLTVYDSGVDIQDMACAVKGVTWGRTDSNAGLELWVTVMLVDSQ